MNANELKQIDFCNPDSTHYANSKHYIAQLEAMISQQQAEIEALKESVKIGLHALENHNGNYKLNKQECAEITAIEEKMKESIK